MAMTKKTWSQPMVTSVEPLKNAAGTRPGVAKGPTLIEYDYNGPGS